MDAASIQPATPGPLRALRWTLLGIAALAYALYFVHLSADLQEITGWNDWSRYTDEGWYSDAAVRHLLLGHWFLPGDFNPAVAMPVWPLLEALVFRFSGVSLVAARALAVSGFGVMLLATYKLVTRCEQLSGKVPASSLAAPLAVLFLCLSPLLYAFEREAILEPLLATLAVLALLAASWLAPGNLWPALALGLLLPGMVLTKPTAVSLLPAIAYLVWARAGCRAMLALRLAWPPALLGIVLWLSYFLFVVKPHYLEDYRYLFSANEYTGFQNEPLAHVAFQTLTAGLWIGPVLYPLFFLAISILFFARPRFFRNPLVPTLLLWTLGYLVFLGYHNNPQPRYYLLLAVPVTVLVAMALEELRRFGNRKAKAMPARLLGWAAFVVVAELVLAIALPEAAQLLGLLRHPSYSFDRAAGAIAQVIRADRTHSPLILSVSGSDLSLMTGLPSINTEFGTLDLDERVRLYRPGWYVAWNQAEDEDMQGITPFYQPVRIATFPAMNDPDRNVLILYRLDPRKTPKLQTQN